MSWSKNTTIWCDFNKVEGCDKFIDTGEDTVRNANAYAESNRWRIDVFNTAKDCCPECYPKVEAEFFGLFGPRMVP